jgi:hypothetical protein
MEPSRRIYPKPRVEVGAAPIPSRPSDLPVASSLMPRPAPAASPDPPDARKASKPGAVGISTQVLYQDMLVTVSVQAPLTVENLAALRAKLKKLGLEPLPAPVVWTPEGLPICPRHHVLMDRRESQGDVWYSHTIKDADGNPVDAEGRVIADPLGRGKALKVYCRGCGGKSSPGWDTP